MMRKAINIALWIFFSLFFIVLAALTFTQTSTFRKIAKNNIIKIANNNINGSINIEKIEGNIFSNLSLIGLSVTLENNDTLVSFSELNLNYSIWPILKNEIRVKSVNLINPYANLEKQNDSTWNFSSLFKPKEPKIKPQKKDPFKLKITLRKLILQNGELNLSMPDSIIPQNVNNINVELAASYSATEIFANISTFNFSTYKPYFVLNNLSTQLYSDYNFWHIKNLAIQTGQNNLLLSGLFESENNLSAQLSWLNIQLSEFEFILPNIKIPATPNLAFEADVKNNRLNLKLELVHDIQLINIDASISNFREFITDSLRHKGDVNINLQTSNFSPNDWIEISPLPLVLNSNLHITGNGLHKMAKPLKISGDISNSKWEHYVLKKGEISLEWMAGMANVRADIGGDFGLALINANINLNSKLKPFSADIQTTNLAVHKILPQQINSTIVSAKLSAIGTGLGTDALSAKFNGLLFNSIIEYIPVDSMEFTGIFADNSIAIDTLIVTNSSINAQLNAFFSLKSKKLTANVKTNIFNTDAFSHYFIQPVKWDSVYVEALANGNTDSISFSAVSYASKVNLDTTIFVNSLNLIADGFYCNKKINIETNIAAANLKVANNIIDSLSIYATLADSLWTTQLTTILPNKITMMLDANGNLAPEMNITLNSLNINSPFAVLDLINAPATVIYSKELIAIKNFEVADKQDSLLSVNIDAYFKHGDSIVATAKINDFNIELLSHFGIAENYMKGRANFDLNLKGDRQRFFINAHANLSDLELDPMAVSQIKLKLNYNGDSAIVSSSIYNNSADSILLTASTPLSIIMNDSIAISWPKTFNASLKSNKTKLSGFFVSMPGFKQPKALISINLNAHGHIEDPIITGKIDVVNGELPIPKYGIDYKDLRLKLLVDDTKIQLDSLFARHHNGTLLARGTVEMDSTLFTGRIKNSNLTLRADQFYLVRHRDFELQIDANTFFKESEKKPTFGGNIKVLRSSFNLPAIMDMANDAASVNEPLLVQSLRQSTEKMSQPDSFNLKAPSSEIKSPLMDNLTGTIKLDVPRNTWIRSPEMQMELYGNLDIVKSANAFELFGSLGIHRGFYALYGKKLIIREGQFTFTGGLYFDPIIVLKADYVFRTKDRLKRTLTLFVSERASDPVISFELDGNHIPEADAMAYLLFGQPFDELNYGNQEGASNAVPTQLLTGLVSSQLSKSIGSALNLDMIEIDAGDNWQNTTFMVGKYITNNLFVTYQRSFGQAENENITPETITLEYELNRRISLRLIHGEAKESGVDVILKFEK